MNIGFDLDKVLIDYPPLVSPKLIDKLYKKRDNGVLLYRIPAYPEQVFRRISHTPFLRPAIKENLEFLKSIPKKSNKLYLISSRFKFLEKRTLKLVKRFDLDKVFDEMYFNFDNLQPHEFKNEVIKRLNLDIYVDDDLSLIKHVAKNNAKTKFFWLNQDQLNKSLSENIFAISKIEMIFEKKLNIKD
ncbi:MAG TPA: hypothetical protein VNA13_02375 [Xanthomonadales bacterium]|nr:hypothetical protein [Xanthomonadales bacterium]